jgi:hypothetical protein
MMSTLTAEQALENVYASLHNDNEDIDLHIDNLKAAMGTKRDITVDPQRLPIQNRAGRKMMQAYFKKRGLSVNFV